MTTTYRTAAALLAAGALTGLLAGAPAAAAGPARSGGHLPAGSAPGGPALDGGGECAFPMKKQIEGTPWPLQRVLLDELWQDTRGKGVRVAVIDTGVDDVNPQLKTAVDAKAGKDFLKPDKENPGLGDERRGKTDGTVDQVGHGTKVAGIIAARPRQGTGFVGLAPEATIIPIRQNDEKNSGKSDTMAQAIDWAVRQKADVVNISQDTTQPLGPDSAMAKSVAAAIKAGVVVVASAGNDGMDGTLKDTYPAAFPGVLAVASSDRNNERAAFSQSGTFVGVAAPGVDIVSTVPGGGQCVDNGTSFSAPYVAGVAALLRAKYPRWSVAQIVTRIEQTAVRSVNGRDNHVGWGVVDPVRALADAPGTPPASPTPDPGPAKPPAPEPARLALAETPRERSVRLATYTLGIGVVLVSVVAGTAVVIRDSRRRREAR
ncbi:MULTISPECIES: type VII secretion-associated serine protease mycosin [unclassified Streptomyces]|uniref:type VII secretion-associated serine protease mycosin n=1 Tax=unclassified Streptomyces TaxID=2593676 RepID=UPI001DD14C5C|nr:MULTISPECIES: type VII secretion-associated serine protease mycosin [unclassified Streptomyces]MBD0711042.1 type VII secretion-associated serine protease mycosin [Streptomyces sp. CBMA291]MBD0716254.1 type VII secretion-associated serine protease mycosin [Streptomyces sp. CBMA370]